MKLAMAAAIVAMPMLAGACERTNGEPLSAQPNVVERPNLAGDKGPALQQVSAQFVNFAAASDRFEIDSSRLAERAAASPAVKGFARMMIDGHLASTRKLKAIVAEQALPHPLDPGLKGEQQAVIDELREKRGADFDEAYLEAQVTAHQKTLASLKEYSGTADNAALKAFADELIPTVAAHLDAARKLHK